MATELGQAYVQIMPSARGISGAIQSQLGGETKTAGTALGGKLAFAIKGAIAVAAIGKFIGASLTEGGELQQSLGGIETLFKDHADKVKGYAKEAYKTVGVSSNEYMKQVTSFSASLLQSLGGDTNKAADVANTAMIDMADNANKMGTSIELIQNAYQGFAKQNYTMLDNLKLGYGGTKTEMQRLLADAQKLTGVKYDISNLSDVYQAIHVIQGEIGITGTTAKEASETLQGSLASMKASFKNVLAGLSIGADITEDVKALSQTIATFLFNNFLPMVFNVLKALPMGLITFFKSAIPLFFNSGTEFIKNLSLGMTMSFPEIVESARQIVDNVIMGFMQEWPKLVLAGQNVVLSLLEGIKVNLPQIGEGAIKITSTFIDTTMKNAPQFFKSGAELLRNLVLGLMKNLPSITSSAGTIIFKFVAMIISKLPEILATGAKIILSIISGLFSIDTDLYQAGVDIINNLLSKFLEWRSKFFNAGKNIVSSIADGIKSAIGVVTEAIDSIAQKVRNFLPFSPAKEGPLRDLHRLDFGIIAEGIYGAEAPVKTAMRSLAQSTADSFGIRNFEKSMNYKFNASDEFAVSKDKGGDLIINIENVNNSSERDIEDFARELEFYRNRKEGI